MNHKELHELLSEDLKALRDGTLEPKKAREIFNGAGKIINNCRNELVAISMGLNVDIPLLEVTKKKELSPVKKKIGK